MSLEGGRPWKLLIHTYLWSNHTWWFCMSAIGTHDKWHYPYAEIEQLPFVSPRRSKSAIQSWLLTKNECNMTCLLLLRFGGLAQPFWKIVRRCSHSNDGIPTILSPYPPDFLPDFETIACERFQKSSAGFLRLTVLYQKSTIHEISGGNVERGHPQISGTCREIPL